MKQLLIIAIVMIPPGCLPVEFGPGSQDFTATLPGKYFIHRTSSHYIVIAPETYNDETPIIPTKVIELDHDNHFLIAKQQLLERRSPNDPNDSYEQPKPDAFQYWILDLQVPKAYGPMTLQKFESERAALGVSTALQLHDVYDYQP